MEKNILVFSNGEKIGDAIIKIPLLYEIKKRLPSYKLIWMANGTTVYNNKIKNFAEQYIDEIIECAKLKPFFWQNISNNYDLKNRKFRYIFDTQKTVIRTIALKRISSSVFISATANGMFSSIKLKKKNLSESRKYYLEELFDLLNYIKKDSVNRNFQIDIPEKLIARLQNIFNKDKKYIGLAPGAGEVEKIWPLDKFIEVGKYFQKKSFHIVLFLGPQESNIKEKLKLIFPQAIFPEDEVNDFNNIEVAMATTKFLSCALANDSGISHILSTKYCPLIKLFGSKDSDKFTPKSDLFLSISGKKFGREDVKIIPSQYVIDSIKKQINL